MIIDLGKKYGNLVLLSSYGNGICREFAKFFPERHYNLGHGAQNLASCAAGFSVRGKMPVIVVESSFFVEAFEQIKTSICEPNLNVKILLKGAVSGDIVKSLPNMQFYTDERAFSEYGPACMII